MSRLSSASSNEEWREFPRNRSYLVSRRTGEIRHKKRPTPLKPGTMKSGHKYVNIRVDGRQVSFTVHRVVLETFIGDRPDRMECRHLDGDPANNRLENLKWDTRAENTKDRTRHGKHNTGNRERCPKVHVLGGENSYPNKQGTGRRGNCRVCGNTLSWINYHPEDIDRIAEIEAKYEARYLKPANISIV